MVCRSSVIGWIEIDDSRSAINTAFDLYTAVSIVDKNKHIQAFYQLNHQNPIKSQEIEREEKGPRSIPCASNVNGAGAHFLLGPSSKRGTC